jgi:transposase
MIIGIDPHKLSHTATAVDRATNTAISSLRVGASLAGYRELLGWARQFPDRRWAIENAKGLGCHLAQWLVARGEEVVDVATTATSRVRELSRGGRRKNDVIDASAAASVAALQGDAQVVDAEDETTVFALLEERRANLASQRVRCVNQLHAVMRDLVAGGVRTALTAKASGEALRKVRPTTRTERIRKTIAWDLVRDVRSLDHQLNRITAQMTETLDGYDNRLLEIDGIGPVLAVRLLGRTGRPSRFRSSDAFASYVGVAPIEVSSGERITHRLSRSGDCRLNSALHLIAVTQVRMRDSAGHRYFDRKIEEGKTRNEAMRCLKRKIASHVWRRMLGADRRRHHRLAPAEAA